MCDVLILDDDPGQLTWIVGVVKDELQNRGAYTLLPTRLNGRESQFELRLPPRVEPMTDELRQAWAGSVLDDADAVPGRTLEIAVVDLCLTDPTQLPDPEGFWVCAELRRRFPECFIILVSSKTTDRPQVSGGWFKYVSPPPVRVDEVVGIRDDDPVSSRSQLAAAVRKGCLLVAAH